MHAQSRLLALAFLTTEVTIGRRALPLEADDDEPFAAAFAPYTKLFHDLLPPQIRWALAPCFMLRFCQVTKA